MKFKSTLTMAIVLSTVASYYYFVDIPQEKKKKEEKERAEKIFQFEKDRVESITLAKKDQKITILKKDGQWRIEKPLQVNADVEAANFLVTILKNARFTRVVDENPSDPTAFGLSDPQLEITVRVQGGKEQTLRLGDDAPIGSFLYIQRKDETKVLLCPTDRKDLDKSLYDLRDKTVLSVSEQEVTDVELSGEGVALHLIQKNKQWVVTGKNVRGQADASEITAMLSALDQAKAQSFVEENPDDLKSYGLDSPYFKLALRSKDGQKNLLIGKPAENDTRYAKTGHGQNIITVANSLAKSFSLKPLDYLSKILIEFEQKQVKSLSLHSDEMETHLIRDPKESGTWTIQKPIETAADTATVNSLLFDLKDTRIAQFIQSSVKDFKPFGLDRAKKVFRLETQDGVIHALNLGNKTKNGKQIFANRTGETHVFLLKADDVEKIFRSLHDLRNKNLLTFKMDEVQKIRLIYTDKIFELIKRGNSWSLVQPVLMENIKDFIASDILWTLNNLEFSSIVETPPDPKSSGLDTPHLTLELWGEDNKGLGTFRVGKPSDPSKHLYAQVRGNPKLYQIQERFLTEIPSDLEKFKS